LSFSVILVIQLAFKASKYINLYFKLVI